MHYPLDPGENAVFPGKLCSLFQGAKDHRGTEVGTSEAGSLPILRILTHALSAVWGGLEAGLTQTVEGALCVDTTPSQTWVCGCTLVNI